MILPGLADRFPVKSRPYFEGDIVDISECGKTLVATVRGATFDIMHRRKYAVVECLRKLEYPEKEPGR